MALEQRLSADCFLQGPQAKNGAYMFSRLVKNKEEEKDMRQTPYAKQK